jgi:kumamolisin
VILVAAASDSLDDLFQAVKVARHQAEAAGGGEVVMSWGAFEFSGEDNYENLFSGTNVVYVAQTGGTPFLNFPAALRNVIAVGVTQINRNTRGDFINQTIDIGEGDGLSQYVKVPGYQLREGQVRRLVGESRGTPDMTFAGYPGHWFYDSTPYEGSVIDWAALSANPGAEIAGILNSAGSFAASTKAELTTIYSSYRNRANWIDIDIGLCSDYGVYYSGLKGFDLCSGVGAPRGLGGK